MVNDTDPLFNEVLNLDILLVNNVDAFDTQSLSLVRVVATETTWDFTDFGVCFHDTRF